jgi:hypothetical protein
MPPASSSPSYVPKPLTFSGINSNDRRDLSRRSLLKAIAHIFVSTKGFMKKAILPVLFCILITAAKAQGWHTPVVSPASDTLTQKGTPLKEIFRLPAVKYNYYQSLGAACKAELKLEQATKIPFRFRLGSLQQTEYLEQKPNAVKPQ